MTDTGNRSLIQCPVEYDFGGIRRPVQCDRFDGHDGQHEHLPLDLAWGPKEPGWTGTPQERGE